MKKAFKKLKELIRKTYSKLFEVEVDYINGPDTLPLPLTPEQEQINLIKHEEGDKEAREELIVRNLRLVVYIAKKFENTGIPVEDLISIGTLGLIKAIRSFDTERGFAFSTYAVPLIMASVFPVFW